MDERSYMEFHRLLQMPLNKTLDFRAFLTKPGSFHAGFRYHLGCCAILAFLEGDYATAKRELEASLAIMEETPHIPYRAGNISVSKAYLCCVLAKLGDRDGAKKNFMDAKEYLVATDEAELLEQCKHAIE
jgi:hypothetical protein